MKIVTIGGATQDIFLLYEGADVMTIAKKNTVLSYMLFESGEKIEVDELLHQVGGGATNSAVSFKRLGFDVSAYCSIGQDQAGQAVINNLTSEKINSSFVYQSSEYPTAQSFIINSLHGERTIFAFRGANSHLQLDKLPLSEIKNSNLLYITSLSNQSALVLPDIVKIAKQHNVPVAINPGSSQLAKGTLSLKKSLQYIDTLIMNSSEARTFTSALVATDDAYKKALESASTQNACALNLADSNPYLLKSPLSCENFYVSMRAFFKETLNMGPKIVVVTNGANGVYVATGSKIYFHPSIKTNVVNTVGAGDAFGSCFTASLQLGYSIPEALRNGIINSASVLEYIGAKKGLLTHAQLKEKIKNLSPGLVETFTL